MMLNIPFNQAILCFYDPMVISIEGNLISSHMKTVSVSVRSFSWKRCIYCYTDSSSNPIANNRELGTKFLVNEELLANRE